MANPTVKTRFQLKNDTEENWNKANNFIPLKGELIIYNAETGQNIDNARRFSRLKVGDGVTPVTELPFATQFSQADWDELDISSASYIKNKPSIPVILSDTSANWAQAVTFVPPENSLIIYTDASIRRDTLGNVIKLPGLKVGDGITTCINLPFLDAGTIMGLTSNEILVDKLPHSITFGANQQYVFDGSEDVTVPVYLGDYRK